MSYHQVIHCISCDREILKGIAVALPIGNATADIVDNDYKGAWAGAPACKSCFDVHAAAGVKALEAHVKATAEIRKELDEAHIALRRIRTAVTSNMDELGL